MHKEPSLIIGKIPFLVCLPYFYRSFPHSCELIEGTPKQLIPQLLSGNIHAAPVSSILYAKNSHDFLICPEISTSSQLEIHSVLLCSQHPIDTLHLQKIWMSQESATSVFLFQLLCKQYLKIQPEYIENNLQREQCVAEILIGDQALQARHSQAWPYIYELDRLWRDWKGLPFVFGIWQIRKDFINPQTQELWTHYFHHLKSNLKDFPQFIDQAIQDWEQNHTLPLSTQESKEFLTRMDYILDEERIHSLQLFYDECHKAQMLPDPVQIQFWKPNP